MYNNMINTRSIGRKKTIMFTILFLKFIQFNLNWIGLPFIQLYNCLSEMAERIHSVGIRKKK